MNSKSHKALSEYMKLPYTIILRRDEEGDVIARIKEFEGCVADGQDEIEALGNLEHVKALWIESCLINSTKVPAPESDQELPSGKWLQRVPRSLHQKLANTAEQEGVSLNQLVTSFLAEAVGGREQERRAEVSSVPNISASAYATSPRACIALVPHITNGGKDADMGDSRQSLEFAANQIPANGKLHLKPLIRQRSASGY